jgi:hypothetical protein
LGIPHYFFFAFFPFSSPFLFGLALNASGGHDAFFIKRIIIQLAVCNNNYIYYQDEEQGSAVRGMKYSSVCSKDEGVVVTATLDTSETPKSRLACLVENGCWCDCAVLFALSEWAE